MWARSAVSVSRATPLVTAGGSLRGGRGSDLRACCGGSRDHAAVVVGGHHDGDGVADVAASGCRLLLVAPGMYPAR